MNAIVPHQYVEAFNAHHKVAREGFWAPQSGTEPYYVLVMTDEGLKQACITAGCFADTRPYDESGDLGE